MNRQGQASTSYDVLESTLLDQSADPTDLPLSLLQDITDGFSDDHQIGIGGFAVVYKGILENGTVAVKKLSETLDIHEEKFNQEVQCLMKAKHKNVVRFLGYCADTQGRTAEREGRFVMADLRNRVLCFEYLPNGSLHQYITDSSSGLEWRLRYRIIKGICEGLHYLHEKRIVHLDLKPANILLDGHMVPKISDFGLSKCFDENKSQTITSKLIGSLGYVAPESYNRQITFKLDIYSLGIIIIEILTGQKGYSTVENVVQSWMNRLELSERDTQLEQVRVCTEIGIECMNFNPKKRPVTQQIIDRLDKLGGADSYAEYDMSSLPVTQGGKQTTNEAGKLVHFDGQLAFTADDLLGATAEIIGKSTYGTTYQATFDDGSSVAVKRLREKIAKGSPDFETAASLAGIRHPNLLSLRAYYYHGTQKLLVFDYMPKGNLSMFLHARRPDTPVDWVTRMTIAGGVASGLAYLHDDKSVVHGNLTSNNVLLDDQYSPKIADVGLSQFMTTAANSDVLCSAGALGYRAPELLKLENANAKTDVYCLGVIILELLTGRLPANAADGMDLPLWVASIVQEKWTSEVFDPKLTRDATTRRSRPEKHELIDTLQLALRCVDASPSVRPEAREVLQRLHDIRRRAKASEPEHTSPLDYLWM